MAGRPLRPATDRRLGRPLPHQLPNLTSAAPIARGLSVPRFHPQVVCGISTSFEVLSPTTGHVPMHYSPVRHSQGIAPPTVRLACVRHAASVQSEPGSNSSVRSCIKLNGIEDSQTDLSLSLHFIFRERSRSKPRTPTLIGCSFLKSIGNQRRRVSLPSNSQQLASFASSSLAAKTVIIVYST